MADCGAILIVDPDEESVARVSSLLALAGFACAHARSGAEAITTVREDRPWLVVLDLRLPDLSGYEVCRQLRDEFGEGLSIILTSADRTEPMDRAAGLLIGADDYVVKPFDSGELLARVRGLARRAQAAARPIPSPPPATGRDSGLTRREQQVLGLLALGRRPREIAHELVISEKTVSSHMQRVLAKLQVNSRAQAVAVAYRDGLMDAPQVVEPAVPAGA